MPYLKGCFWLRFARLLRQGPRVLQGTYSLREILEGWQ